MKRYINIACSLVNFMTLIMLGQVLDSIMLIIAAMLLLIIYCSIVTYMFYKEDEENGR